MGGGERDKLGAQNVGLRVMRKREQIFQCKIIATMTDGLSVLISHARFPGLCNWNMLMQFRHY